MSKIDQPSIKKNFLYNTAFQVLTLITPFITAPYLSRVLGVDNIGIFSYTTSILYYFTLFLNLGTYIYGSREISRNRDNKELVSKIFYEIVLLKLINFFVISILWLSFILLTDNYKLYYALLSFGLLASFFDISWFFVGLEQFKITVLRNTIIKISGIIFILLFVKNNSQLWLYIIFVYLFDLLGHMSLWFSLRKFIVKINIKKLQIKKHFKETFVYFIPTIATSIYLVLDKTLLGIFTNDISQNGYYEQANKIITLVKTICFSSISSVMGTRISYLFEHNQIDEIKTKINKSLDLVLFMSIGSCFGLIGISKNFIPFFFGYDYLPAIILLQLMSPLLIIVGISIISSNLYFIPKGLRKKSCLFEVAGAIVNLILSVILIPRYKGIGTVIGTLIAEIIITTCYIVFSNGFITFKNIFILSWKKIIAACFMLVYLLILNNFVNLQLWLLLLIQISGGIIIYSITLLILRDKNIFIIFNSLLNKFVKKNPN